MDAAPDNEDGQIRSLVEQLYESEGLTDALTDEAATLLLSWGERQINNLAQLHLDADNLEKSAHALQQALRAVNRLMAQRREFSDTEMIEHLLKLVDQVITITLITQNPAATDTENDQIT